VAGIPWNQYRFGCMIASDSLFDSSGRFSGSTYPKKTAKVRALRGIAMAVALMGDNDTAISYKGWLVFSQPIHLLVAYFGFVVAMVGTTPGG